MGRKHGTDMHQQSFVAQMTALGYLLEVHFILFLCGYFDSGYLGYEAAEGIDWIWEHRIDDLAALNLL